MKKGSTKKDNSIGKFLRQFSDDWLPTDVYWPSYGRSYVYYPGRKEEEARRRWREKRQEEQDRIRYLKKKRWIVRSPSSNHPGCGDAARRPHPLCR